MGVRVRERPKGSGQWWVFMSHAGKRKAKKVGTDKARAEEVAEKIRAKIVLGDLNIEKLSNRCPSFGGYAEIWMALPQEWKESTRESYQSNLDNHVLPVFENRRLDTIGRKELKGFFTRLLAGGLALSTVKIIRAPLNGVLEHAFDSEIIESNPCHGIKLPRKKNKFNVTPLTEKEAVQMIESAKTYLAGYYYPLILCAVRTGMRIGEMKALKWSDIDFKKRQIEVTRSCRRERITDTKNHKSRRVDMTPLLSETLKKHKTYQKKAGLKRGQPMPEWVFANKNGKIIRRAVFENALNRCLDAAELQRIRIHDLRHTYATIRLLRGHNIGDVSYQLGHSSIKMTYDIYAHWMPGKFKNEVDELDVLQPAATYTQPGKIENQNL